jgi:hypothetical protein
MRGKLILLEHHSVRALQRLCSTLCTCWQLETLLPIAHTAQYAAFLLHAFIGKDAKKRTNLEAVFHNRMIFFFIEKGTNECSGNCAGDIHQLNFRVALKGQ